MPRSTEFGKPLINSIFTLGLVVGLSVQDTTLGTTVGNLGFEETDFPSPVFAGDTHPGGDEVLAVRDEQVAPDARGSSPSSIAASISATRRSAVLPSRRADAEAARMKLRSLLFVPGDSERKFAKASGIGADALILDLEDSVAPPTQGAGARSWSKDLLDGPAARLGVSTCASIRSTPG